MSPDRYVVRDAGALMRQLGVSLIGALVLAGIVGGVQGRWGLAGLMVAATLLLTVNSARHAWTRLVVGPAGLAMSVIGSSARARPRRGLSPWPTIHRVEVLPQSETVRVVLRADAPLPDWVSGRIIDPSEPQAGGSWEKEVPGLDPVAFELAVRAHAPEIEIRTLR